MNSSAEDSETEKSCFEDNSKSIKNITPKVFQFNLGIQQKTIDKTSKHFVRMDDGSSTRSNEISDIKSVKKDLRVSHYPKNVIEPIGNQTEACETSKINEKFIKKSMMSRNSICVISSLTNSLEASAEKVVNIMSPLSISADVQMSLPRLPFEVSQITHHVVDVVPKPVKTQFSSDHNILDQTIGIPINDLITYHDSQNVVQPSVYRPSFNFDSNFVNVRPYTTNVFHNNKIWNIATDIPNIIHHPMISGNIPHSLHPTNDTNHSVRKKIITETLVASIPTKPGTRQNFNNSSSILSGTAQQTPFMKRENGERNKVKFSNTVTVAVVPVSKFLHVCCNSKTQ